MNPRGLSYSELSLFSSFRPFISESIYTRSSPLWSPHDDLNTDCKVENLVSSPLDYEAIASRGLPVPRHRSNQLHREEFYICSHFYYSLFWGGRQVLPLLFLHHKQADLLISYVHHWWLLLESHENFRFFRAM